MGKATKKGLFALLLVFTGCRANEICNDNPGKTWCDEGNVMGCDQDPGPFLFGSLVEVYDVCADQGMTCMEQWEQAACVHRDRPCEQQQDGLCRDGQHVTCIFGFESTAKDCTSIRDPFTEKQIASSGGFCVVLQNGSNAGCSMVDSECPKSGETQCQPLVYDNGTETSAKLVCEEGLWTLKETYPESTECNVISISDAGVDGGDVPDAGPVTQRDR
jgi:hypothetical protein